MVGVDVKNYPRNKFVKCCSVHSLITFILLLALCGGCCANNTSSHELFQAWPTESTARSNEDMARFRASVAVTVLEEWGHTHKNLGSK